MQGVVSCDTCARLEAMESRIRAAYEGTIRTLDRIDDPASARYMEFKRLADETWLALEAATLELESHRSAHQTSEK